MKAGYPLLIFFIDSLVVSVGVKRLVCPKGIRNFLVVSDFKSVPMAFISCLPEQRGVIFLDYFYSMFTGSRKFFILETFITFYYFVSLMNTFLTQKRQKKKKIMEDTKTLAKRNIFLSFGSFLVSLLNYGTWS